MIFNETKIALCLENLVDDKITVEEAYKVLIDFALNTLKENKFEINDLNIMYVSFLMYARVLSEDEDFGYKEKLNSPKTKFARKYYNFSKDESLARSMAVFCINISMSTKNNKLTKGAKILETYIESFDYFKEGKDMIE